MLPELAVRGAHKKSLFEEAVVIPQWQELVPENFVRVFQCAGFQQPGAAARDFHHGKFKLREPRHLPRVELVHARSSCKVHANLRLAVKQNRGICVKKENRSPLKVLHRREPIECTISVINYTHMYTVPFDINDDMKSSLRSKFKQLGSQVPRNC